MYGSETWALGKGEQDLLERTEVRMLRWMMVIKWTENITNEDIRARESVTNISKKIREVRLIWLGHVERKSKEDAIMWKWVDTER